MQGEGTDEVTPRITVVGPHSHPSSSRLSDSEVSPRHMESERNRRQGVEDYRC